MELKLYVLIGSSQRQEMLSVYLALLDSTVELVMRCHLVPKRLACLSVFLCSCRELEFWTEF